MSAVFATALALGAPSGAAAATGWSDLAPLPEVVGDAEIESGKRPNVTVAAGRDGTTWAAWIQTDDTAATTTAAATARIQVATRPAGGAWGLPTTLGTLARAAGSNFDAPSVVQLLVSRSGQPTVAWAEMAAAEVRVKATTRTAAGAWPAATVLGTQPSTGYAGMIRSISLIELRDTSLAAAWQGDAGVSLARRTPAGAWGAAPTQISADAVATPDRVGLGADTAGELTFVYEAGVSGGAATDRTVQTRTLSTGGILSAPITLSTEVGVVDQPSLAVDATGAAVATWASGDGARAAVRAAGASAFAPTQSLTTGSANGPANSTNLGTYRLLSGTGVPSAAFDRHGVATVVWPQKDPDVVVKARQVDQTGTWRPESVVATAPTTNPPTAPRVLPGRDGSATVLWGAAMNIAPPPGGGLPTFSGGDLSASYRASASGTWSSPTVFRTPTVGGYRITAIGTLNDGNFSVAQDAVGNATALWGGYFNAVSPTIRPVEFAHHGVSVTPSLDWTSRGVTGTSNLRTWESYLYTNWPGPGPTTSRGIEVSGGATKPEPTDRSSWRFTQKDAWLDEATGKTIVTYDGTLRWVSTAHYIDSQVHALRLEIAADGKTAVIYSDGQASGSMEDAINGNPTTTPVKNVRLLNLDLTEPGTAPQLSADGTVRTWSDVAAKLAPAAASTYGMDQYASQPFGFLTISVPAQLQPRVTPDDQGGDDQGGGDQGGGAPAQPSGPAAPAAPAAPAPTPTPSYVVPTTSTLVTGKIKGSKKAKKSVKIDLTKALGAKVKSTYRVRVYRQGVLVATGTVKGSRLTLTAVNRAKKGKKPKYAVLSGTLVIKPATRWAGKKIPASKRIKTTTIEVTR